MIGKMKNSNPKVTIVTVCYNAERDIESTLLSVLGQTYSNIEYIVVDGGSTDGTCDIIRRYSDRIDIFVSEPDHGVYDAMNKAAAKAGGEWLLFMNAGDVFFSMDTVSDTFDREISDETGFLFGDAIFVECDKRTLVKYGDLRVHSVMPACHQSIFCRTCILRDNPFNLKYKYAADYDFFYRLKCAGVKSQYLDMVISLYENSRGLSKENEIKVRKERFRCSNSLPLFIIKYSLFRLKGILTGLFKKDAMK
jgi:glycosyltransferase involved in cell wall biosynthesis